MRVAAVLLLLALPSLGASAVSAQAPVARFVDVPPVAPDDGTAFLVGVEVEGAPFARADLRVAWGPEGRVASRTWNGTDWARADRYAVTVALDGAGRWRGEVAIAANPDSANRAAFLAEPATVRVAARGGPEDAATLPPARLEVVPVAASARAVAFVGDVPALAAPAGVPGSFPALDGTAWLALPPGADAVSADGGDPAPPAAPPALLLVEVAPAAPEAVVVAAPEGGAFCLVAAGRARCASTPPDARVVFADDAEVAAWGERVDLPLGLPLADARGNVTLAWGTRALDFVAWTGASRLETFRPDGSSSRLGRSDLAPAPFRASGGRALVAPYDTFAAFAEVVEGAREALVGEVYTFTSPEMAALVAEAARRGVDVRILVEEDPVGGRTDGALAAVAAAGADVRTIRHGRYSTLHAKWIAADGERALVTTDNWNAGAFPPDGEGGTRGYGLLVESEDLALALEDVWERDARGPDVRPWEGTAEPVPPATWRPRGPTGVALAPFEGRLLLAPDHALDEVVAAVGSAEREVLAAALRLDPAWSPNPLAESYAAAAARGVDVRVLLAAAPEGRDNAAAAAALVARGVDARVEVSEEVRLLHAKTWVVDGERVLVGSLNGNRASAEDNREVVLDVWSRAAAGYFAQVFGRDRDAEVPAVAGPLVAFVLFSSVVFTRRAHRP